MVCSYLRSYTSRSGQRAGMAPCSETHKLQRAQFKGTTVGPLREHPGLVVPLKKLKYLTKKMARKQMPPKNMPPKRMK